ncbi:hypothetical protein DERP_002128 [Dermatophagoides pteronyssinus]|uniref:Uncharacterized protein n=1 Tax=Dermatophagoides pteronyssinus TaxID=6956 RepID=A0ABQ8JGV9_DERPT|nr:hypothetical protein DERP_002128 [Dermatophagoides pteronyssinus]
MDQVGASVYNIQSIKFECLPNSDHQPFQLESDIKKIRRHNRIEPMYVCVCVFSNIAEYSMPDT